MSETGARRDYNEIDIWKYRPSPPDARRSPYYIFISCPGDVAKEYLNQIKGEIRDSFNAANKNHRTIEILHWESDQPAGIYSGGTQNEINRLVQDADALIALFWTRLGEETTVDKIRYRSGTTAEICYAVEHNIPTKILVLDCGVHPSQIDPEQLQKSNDFLRDVRSVDVSDVSYGLTKTLHKEKFIIEMLMELSDACDEIDKGSRFEYTQPAKEAIRKACIVPADMYQGTQKEKQISLTRP